MDTAETEREPGAGKGNAPLHPGLTVVFAAEGDLEGAWIPVGQTGETVVFGRGGRTAEDPHRRALPTRQRPGKNEAIEPVADRFVSQVQLAIATDRGALVLRNLGKRDLLDVHGRAHDELRLLPGEIAEIRGRLLLRAGARLEVLPRTRSLSPPYHPFGAPDPDGLVGETDVTWRIRDAVAFLAQRSAHVLVLGETGTGKEIIANGIHRQSARGNRRLISRNAATLPEGLIDAELFGHVANYPNAGMPARSGLVADADGSTLFLDEIGELSHDLAAKLLRVLDERGEYQQLGDTRTRRSSFRLVAATNRPAATLKHDLLARCRLRLEVPPLRERADDIPLIARALLHRVASEDAAIGERFFEGWDGQNGRARVSIDLMKRLLVHDYAANVRELELVLWASLGASPDGELAVGSEVEQLLVQPPASAGVVDANALTKEQIQEALERCGGVHEKAWRELGVANRYVLRRLIKKFSL